MLLPFTAMVSELKMNGADSAEAMSSELPPALIEKPEGLPPGNYALVGWDMDTTGRRLIDEVFAIFLLLHRLSFASEFMEWD